MRTEYDAIVVGAGPNGLAAAITLARERLSVLVLEAQGQPGGGAKSAELTLPGFVHDVCSAIHPFGQASPFFQSLDLAGHGLEWIHPAAPVAHPLDGGQAVVLPGPLAEAAGELGADGRHYEKLLDPFVRHADRLLPEVLQPLLHWPKHPVLLGRFGVLALQPAYGFCRRQFDGERARALFAGLAAHSFLSLHATASAAVGLVLNTLAHAGGWPLPRGGAGAVTAALVRCLTAAGGEIQTGIQVQKLGDLPPARAVLLDVAPRNFLALAGDRLPAGYCRALERFQYGPGVFKVDFALSGPIPWANPGCRRAGTVHLGGTLEQIAGAEEQVSQGALPARPFVLVTQPTLFDPSRAPAGRHIAWAYCHQPNGSAADLTEAIAAQIERFAPGFRDCILAKAGRNGRQMEAMNSNLVGGDINGGRANLRQMLVRPVLGSNPYRTPLAGVYLCSASTPPGGGVHGMCGYHAARRALREVFGM